MIQTEEVSSYVSNQADMDSALQDNWNNLLDGMENLQGLLAASQSVSGGSYSSTVVAWCSGMVPKLKPQNNYILYKQDDHTYCFYYGDFTFSGGRFTGDIDDGTIFTTPHGNDSNYRIDEAVEFYLDVSPGDSIVYSDLGMYPALTDANTSFLLVLAIMLSVGIFMGVLRPIFAFLMRVSPGPLRRLRGGQRRETTVD